MCGKPPSDEAPLSRRGNHYECAAQRVVAAAGEMHAKAGPTWDKYREAMKAALDV